MTDTTRNLLISLSSHMAYMQGQLEARHELDNPEDFYWYRESVLLRQKVTDALADEPAAVTGQPSDEELESFLVDVAAQHGDIYWAEPLVLARAVLARWANPAPAPVADEEVAELVAWLEEEADDYESIGNEYSAARWRRAAELLQRQALVPASVSERLPGPGDCEDEGWAWFFNKRIGWRQAVLPVSSSFTHWLPAHALPTPQQQETNDD